MTIFRNKEDEKLYIIEYLLLDLYHLNCNAYAGVYALPFDHNGERIVLLTKSRTMMDDFVESNFEEVAHV